jgi:hypothetical protein
VASLFDVDGKLGIDFGVYGVPETFIIDRQGVIRYKHIGPVTPEVLRDKIEPLIKSLQELSPSHEQVPDVLLAAGPALPGRACSPFAAQANEAAPAAKTRPLKSG